VANVLGLVSFFIDMEIGARKEVRRKHLDCETDGIGGARESLVSQRGTPEIPTLRREQLGFEAEIKQLCLVGIIEGVHLFQKTTALEAWDQGSHEGEASKPPRRGGFDNISGRSHQI
jgi:hypothetical protein